MFCDKINVYESNGEMFLFLNVIDVRNVIMLLFKSMFRIISVFSKSFDEYEFIKFKRKNEITNLINIFLKIYFLNKYFIICLNF